MVELHRVQDSVFADRYRIERELGRGGTAIVYLANDTASDRSVAIKILRPEFNEAVGAVRFLREIEVSRGLHHPRILPVLDAGECDRQLYFVLPFMEGGTLRDRLNRDRQLPIEDAVRIARTVSEALEYAHEHHLIHRDVKPENILFSGSEAFLGDFGIARAMEQAFGDTTSTGVVRGTPAYMSPEQASGDRHYDGRSDLYSLGCVLYEMLAGMPAFIGPTQQSVIAQRFMHAPRALDVYRPAVSPGLAQVVERALAQAPADRWQTAREFCDALDHTVAAPMASVSTSTPVRRAAPRRLRVVGLASAAAVVAAMTIVRWGGDRNRDATLEPTRLLVSDIQGDSGLGSAVLGARVRDALAAWRGLQVIDAPGGRRSAGGATQVSDSEVAASARRSGAARFFRGQLVRDGTVLRLTLSVHDARDGQRLLEIIARAPNLNGLDDSLVHGAVDRLVVGDTSSADLASYGARDFVAVSTYSNARRALADWDLDRADSLLQSSIVADRSLAAAKLWLAQTRAWNKQDASRWRSLAQLAAGDSVRLSARDRLLASGLLALADGQFERACSAYDALRGVDGRDFAAWYGLGQCRALDHVVIADRRSPSGYRFRSSYQRAITAYTRAFELLPTIYQGFRGEGYANLRSILFMSSTAVRGGHSIANDQQYGARLELQGDSLVFIPYPLAALGAEASPAARAARRAATERVRRVFVEIADSWSAALPDSPGAKEAVAIALETIGDESAVDTLRGARALAREGADALRLRAEHAAMLLKFGLSEGGAALTSASALIDSVLSQNPAASLERATLLAPLAAIAGRCRLAQSYERAVTTTRREAVTLPGALYAASRAMSIAGILHCPVTARPQSPRELAELLSTTDGGWTESQRRTAEYLLLATPLVFATGDSLALTKLLARSGDDLLRMRLALIRRDTAAVRSGLEKLRRVRFAGDSPVPSADAVLAEARLWLAVRDTATAARWTDLLLNRTREIPYTMFNDGVRAASVLELIALRAQIAAARGEQATAQHWIQVLHILAANADSSFTSRIPLVPTASPK